MEKLHYLYIALFILFLIGLFGNSSSNQFVMPPQQQYQYQQGQQGQPTVNKTVVVANPQQRAPRKYGYVPPPAYNPYKNRYYN
jgi:hypothetical protein